MAGFAGMRVHAAHEDARPREAEEAREIGREHVEDLAQQRLGDRGAHLAQRQVRRRQCHTQAARNEQHHGPRDAAVRGEVFGVAGEGDAGFVDDALLHRRRDDRVELVGDRAGHGGVEQREHIGRVAAVGSPCLRRRTERGVRDPQLARHVGVGFAAPVVVQDQRPAGRGRALGEQCAITEADEFAGPGAARDRRAQLGADARGFAGGERDAWQAHQAPATSCIRRRLRRAGGAATARSLPRPCFRATRRTRAAASSPRCCRPRGARAAARYASRTASGTAR